MSNNRTFFWAAALAFPLAAYAVAQAVARPIPPHPVFEQFTDRPLVIAHRGGQGLWPSNTLYAFERAMEMGADMLELDVHASRDGVLVVMHDETVNRTTNGTGLIKEKSFAEIEVLEAGYHWSEKNASSDRLVDTTGPFPYRGKGIRVPTLEEVFQKLPNVPMTIEIKQAEPSINQALGTLIRKYGKQNQVIIGSFHTNALNNFRLRFPEIATSGHADDIRRLVYLEKVRLSSLLSPGYQAIQVPMRYGRIKIITPHSVRAAQERGLQTHVWTVNDVDEMQSLIQMGIDGIITDRPDRLLSLLKRAEAGISE